MPWSDDCTVDSESSRYACVVPETDENPSQDRPQAGRRPNTDISALAVTATFAVVVFSIFLGVFGPRIGNRPGFTVGVPLGELAVAVESRHGERIVNAIHAAPRSVLTAEEAQSKLKSILTTEVVLPELERSARWISVDAVALPGGRAAVLFAQFRVDGRTEYATTCIFNDEDRFTVYDTFGRPIGLPDGEVFAIEPPSEFGGTTIVAWRNGALVWVLASGSQELLESFEAMIHAANPTRALVREVQVPPMSSVSD